MKTLLDKYNTLRLLALLGFLSLSYNYLSEVPNSDDYDAYLGFALAFFRADNFWDGLKLIPSFHGEHLVAFPRAVFLLSTYFFSPEFLFFGFGLISNALIVACFYLISSHKDKSTSVVCTMFLCSPVIGELFSFITAGASVGWGISLAVSGLILTARGKLWQRRAGYYMIVCSILSWAGCIAVLAIVVFGGLTPQDIKSKLCSSSEFLLPRKLIFTLIIIALSFITWCHFAKLSYPTAFFADAHAVAEFSLALMGSAFAFSNFFVAKLIGLGFVCVMLFFLLFKGNSLAKENRNTIIFLLFCILAISFGRYQNGLSHSYLTSRYKLCSVLSLIAIWQASCSVFPVRTFAAKGCLFAAAGLMVFCQYLFCFNELSHRYYLLEDSRYRYLGFSKGLLHPSPEHAFDLVEKGKKENIFKIRDSGLELGDAFREIRKIRANDFRPDRAGAVTFSLEYANVSSKYLHLSGWAFGNSVNAKSVSNVRFILRNKDHLFELSAAQRVRPDVFFHFRKGRHRNVALRSGFSVFSDTTGLTPGEYEVFVEISQDSRHYGRLIKKIQVPTLEKQL